MYQRGCSRHPQCVQPYEEQLAKRQEVAVNVRIFFSRKRNSLNIKSNIMSEYYACRRCEDEVNQKDHLTKPQEAVHVENVTKEF